VVGQAGLLLAIGAAVGGVLAFGMTAAMDRILVSQLPNPGGWVFPGVALVLGVAGLLASWVPARRALRVQPNEALRHS
jgi:ABC-type antimicrobial peptide transport system permease subunit